MQHGRVEPRSSEGLNRAETLVDDALWERVKPLLPPPKKRRRRFPGRKPLDGRQVLTGILFVLRNGIPWRCLPKELGCGSGVTCWRRLRLWQELGIWKRIEEILLARHPEPHLAVPEKRKRNTSVE